MCEVRWSHAVDVSQTKSRLWLGLFTRTLRLPISDAAGILQQFAEGVICEEGKASTKTMLNARGKRIVVRSPPGR